jgi:predicted dehydrogenase
MIQQPQTHPISTLKGAVIGYGFISGKGHIPAYLQRQKANQKTSHSTNVQIIAVADICAERRALAAKELPEARIYSDYESLLKQEAKNLDFVDISTPPCDHAKIAHAAFDLGLHVLCEKPLTTTLAEAAALLDHAKKAKKVLFPCHNYKHAPVVKAIREIIQSGRIGKIRSVTLSTFRNTHAKGVTEWKTNWRRFQEFSGGGIAMDHGSHSFYLTFDWLGEYPIAITAKMSNLEPQKFDTEDNFSAVLTFPNGLAHCHLTWTAGVRKVIYTLQGESGAITVEDDDLQVAIQEKTSGPDVAQGAVTWKFEKSTIESDWMDASHVTWFNAMFDQFATAIADQDYVGKEAKEAYRCIEIITKAYESAKNNCVEKKLDGIR